MGVRRRAREWNTDDWDRLAEVALLESFGSRFHRRPDGVGMVARDTPDWFAEEIGWGVARCPIGESREIETAQGAAALVPVRSRAQGAEA